MIGACSGGSSVGTLREAVTCTSCHESFSQVAILREHYKSDWHRYNLKRKLLEVGPVSLSEYEKKVEEHEGKQEEEKPEEYFCIYCKKAYLSENSFTSHLRSWKHDRAFRSVNSRFLGKENIRGIRRAARNSTNPDDTSSSPRPETCCHQDRPSPLVDIIAGNDTIQEQDPVLQETRRREMEWTLKILSISSPRFVPVEERPAQQHVDCREEASFGHSSFLPKNRSDFLMKKEIVNSRHRFLQKFVFCETRTDPLCRDDKNNGDPPCRDDKNNGDPPCCDDQDDQESKDVQWTDDDSCGNSDSAGDLPLVMCPDTMDLILPSGKRAGHRSLKAYFDQNPISLLRSARRSDHAAGTTALKNSPSTQSTHLALGNGSEYALCPSVDRRFSRWSHNEQVRLLTLGIISSKSQRYFRSQNPK